MDDSQGNSTELLRLIFKKRFFILFVTGFGILTAVICSAPFIIPPRFSSEVILYPPATNSNRMLIERDLRFGSDKEIDEHIQLLRSSIVRDTLISKYDLYKHYRIDTLAQDKRYHLYEKFSDRVKIERTRYNSISVSVSDEDPLIAASMANDIVAVGDAYKATIIKAKLQEAYKVLFGSIQDLSRQLDKSASGINLAYNKAVVSGGSFYKRTGVDQLKEQLDVKELMEKARAGNEIQLLDQLYFYESRLQQLATLQNTYDQALISINNQIPSSFVISPGEVADKKSFPIRWMIVLITGIATFVAAISAVIIIERLQKLFLLVRQKP